MLARFYFSHKHLQGKNISEVQDMLMLEKGVNWNNLDVWKKRGSCITLTKTPWASTLPVSVDEDIPIFTQNRDYIERLLEQEEEPINV